jgi:Zn-dependent protease
MQCIACGSELAPRALACPGCHRLVHQEALEGHAAAAEVARQGGDVRAELAAWRSAMPLLPLGSRQLDVIAERVGQLSTQVAGGTLDEEEAPSRTSKLGKAGAAAAAGGAVLWKLKALLLVLLGKGKLLLLGFSKAGTLLSMLLSFGAYWALWGWKFAAGLVLSIYVHEMGHVAALRRFGIPATAPMFIPGVGAFVRLKQHPATAVEDARVGLAGPWWGLGAALVATSAFLAGGGPVWAAIARTGGWINLFNLLPIAPLDGGRAFHALSKPQRWLALLAIGGAWLLTHDGMLVLLGLVAAGQALAGRAPETGDRRTLLDYALLTLALAALTLLPVPVPPHR